MFYFKGTILNRKNLKSNKGETFTIFSVLDQNDRFSVVRDVADFNNFVQGIPDNVSVEFPVSFRLNVSKKDGRAFLNMACQAEPVICDV